LIWLESSPTISGEMLSAEPFAFSASPLNFRTMRRYFGLVKRDLGLDFGRAERIGATLPITGNAGKGKVNLRR
jgi:hypothetical protein